MLLANGADINAKTKDGATPIDLAAVNGQRDVVELLFHHGGTPLKTLALAVPIFGAVSIAAFIWIEWLCFDKWTNGGKGGNGSVLPWAVAFLALASLLFNCVRDIFSRLRRLRLFSSLGIQIQDSQSASSHRYDR